MSNDVEESAIKIFVRDKILPLYGAVDRQKDNLGITIADDDTSPFAAAYRIVSRSGDQIKAAFDQEDTQLLRVLLELPDRLGDHMSTVNELEMNGALPHGWGMDDDLTETLIKVQERINHFLNHYVPPGEHSKLVEFIKEKIEPVYQQGHKDVLRHRRMLTFSDRGHPVIEIEHTYDNLGVKSWLRTALYLPEREALSRMALFADQAGITVSRMRAHEARANVDWKGLKPSEAVEQIMTETQAFLDQNKFSAQAATSVKETREIK